MEQAARTSPSERRFQQRGHVCPSSLAALPFTPSPDRTGRVSRRGDRRWPPLGRGRIHGSPSDGHRYTHLPTHSYTTSAQRDPADPLAYASLRPRPAQLEPSVWAKAETSSGSGVRKRRWVTPGQDGRVVTPALPLDRSPRFAQLLPQAKCPPRPLSTLVENTRTLKERPVARRLASTTFPTRRTEWARQKAPPAAQDRCQRPVDPNSTRPPYEKRGSLLVGGDVCVALTRHDFAHRSA